MNTPLPNPHTHSNKKIAIVSDKLAGAIGGAESILFIAHELYPTAPIFTTVLDRNIIPEKYKNAHYETTFIQNLPNFQKFYKIYFPLMPLAHELLQLQDYDVIFSSHHSVAKSIIPRPDAFHVCYCHSPARYIWDMFWTYSSLNGFNGFQNFFVAAASSYIRMLDVTSANRVDYFLANSKYTAQRIEKFYNRPSEILYPPVRTTKFHYEPSEGFYLMTGRMVAYKGFELAVDAFNANGKQLVIIGDGPEYQKLKAKAAPNVKLLGRVSEESLEYHMNHCKGFVFPGKEDFGIVMAEAQSAGKPVIGLKAGGALDIVVDGETGVLFENYTVEALNKAIALTEEISWDPKRIAENAQRFDENAFRERLHYILENSEAFPRKL
ncbi:MAG: glycosyltransferase [Cyanobacteria bacterium]|nr:glycosyltransferase [Cyanobacteriota bacterium]